MAGTGAAATGASTLGAPAATATTGAVTGLSWKTIAGAALFSAVVSVGGWYGTQLLVGPEEVGGLDLGTSVPGIAGSPSMPMINTQGWTNATMGFGAITGPAYGATGAATFTIPMSLSGTCGGRYGYGSWAPVVTGYAYLMDGTRQRFATSINGPAYAHAAASLGDTCTGALTGSAQATIQLRSQYTNVTGRLDHLHLTNANFTGSLDWYPLGHPQRPGDVEPGSGTITQTVVCAGAGGATQVVTATTEGSMLPGSAWVLPDVLCPPGMVAVSVSASWTPAVPGGQPQPLVPETPTEDWVTQIPTEYPLCLDENCYLELHRIQPAPEVTCGPLATDCPDWYIDPNRAQNYECTWGPYLVDLDRCSAFRDPGTVRPTVDDTGTYTPWPPLELDSGPVARLISQLLQRYSPTQSCEVLGESIRSYEPAASVPDFVVVCGAEGVAAGLGFATLTPSVTSTQELVDALIDAATGATPPVTYPDCEYLADDGRCLDDEPFVGEDPALQPAPAGAGILPPENCMSYDYWSGLIDALPTEEHHILTNKHDGYYTEVFDDIVSTYNLDLDGAWNKTSILHRGRHSSRYHNWVMKNVEAIDRVAQGNVTTFLTLFDQWVKQPLEADPTILRAKYWECHPT